jgi:hypothetical protein
MNINALRKKDSMERASTCAVDTLAIFQRLKNASLQEEAASEIASVLKDVVESNTVNLSNLEQVKSDLELKIEQTKTDLVRWVAGLMIAQAAVIVALIKLL